MVEQTNENASRGRGSPTSPIVNALDETPWHLADLECLVGETCLNDEVLPPSKPRSYRPRSTSRKREKHREPQRPRSLSKGAMEKRGARAAAASDDDDDNTNQRRKPSSERRGRSPGALPRRKSNLVKKILKELEANSRAGGIWKSGSGGGLEAMKKSLMKRGRSPGALKDEKDHRPGPSVENKKETNKKPAAMERRNVNHGGDPGKSKTRKHEYSSPRDNDKRPSSFSLPRRTASDSRYQ